MPWQAPTIVQQHGARRASRPQLKRDPLGSKHMLNRLTVLLLLLGAFSCHRTESSAQPTVDTTLVFVAEPAPGGRGPTLRVLVARDARVYADGRSVTIPMLDSIFSALRIRNGGVSYYRAAPERRPTRQQDSVVKAVAQAVARHGLSITFLSRTDSSTFIAAYDRVLHAR